MYVFNIVQTFFTNNPYVMQIVLIHGLLSLFNNINFYKRNTVSQSLNLEILLKCFILNLYLTITWYWHNSFLTKKKENKEVKKEISTTLLLCHIKIKILLLL